MLLVDMPEGLPVPGISKPSKSIPPWKQDTKEWLQPIFDFADQHLHDDGAIIIIHPFRASTKSNVLGYCKSYGFEVRKEWWGMNRLHLASALDSSLMVSSLCYILLYNSVIPTLSFAFFSLIPLSFMADNVIWNMFGGPKYPWSSTI